MKKLKATLEAKDMELAKKEEDLRVSQKKRETLMHEISEIKEKIENALKKISAELRPELCRYRKSRKR